jgi:adenosylcobinamide-GDP ribazoletransferase
MLQFFTRLPLPFDLKADSKDFSKGLIWFTTVGLVIGILLAGLFMLLSPWIGMLTLSVVLVLAEALITGGLHLDGLADTFDGLYSNREKERSLEIMKDSRIGSNGALALIAYFLLKIALLNELLGGMNGVSLIQHPAWLLLIMPVSGKAALGLSCFLGPYARKEGMGHLFIGKVSRLQLILLLMIGFAFTAVYPVSAVTLAVVLMVTPLYTRHVRKRIDGLTGDTLGAWHELSELVYLASWLVIVRL